MTEETSPKRGRGRPRVNPVEGSRRNATLQLSAELYEALREASDRSGLSISREMEQRIEASFRNNDLHALLLGGERPARMLHYFSAVMRSAKTVDGKSWEDDPALANAVGMAFYYLTLICSKSHSEANNFFRNDHDLEKRILYAAQLISNYVVLSYGADFNPVIMQGREGAITPAEAVQRFIVDGESI